MPVDWVPAEVNKSRSAVVVTGVKVVVLNWLEATPSPTGLPTASQLVPSQYSRLQELGAEMPAPSSHQ